jgi:anti-sigma B factor antagonist
MQALSVDRDGEALVLSLRGEIDFLNAPPIVEAITQALAQQRPAKVRVDVSEVTFMDSSGIGVLVSAMHAAEDVSASFRVVHPNARVLDQLDGVGLVEVFGLAGFEVDPPVEEAVGRSPAVGEDR